MISLVKIEGLLFVGNVLNSYIYYLIKSLQPYKYVVLFLYERNQAIER